MRFPSGTQIFSLSHARAMLIISSLSGPKMVKITASKLTVINKTRKNYNFGKHVCQNSVAMATLSFRHSNMSYQIIFR